MRIQQVTIFAPDVSEMGRFYGGQLGMALTPLQESLEVQAGASRLDIRRSDGPVPAAHFAFNVAPDQFELVVHWLGQRTELLLQPEGVEIAEFPRWSARAVYALDPAGNIIEFIARDRIAGSGKRSFEADTDLLGISEIGLVVDDVPGTSADLRERFGIPEFDGGSDEFCALGDDEGLLILSKTGRAWRPIDDVPGAPCPLRVDLKGVASGQWRYGSQVVRAE